MADNPALLSLAFMVRDDRKALFVRHAGGPFGGRWSLPLIGVAGDETAEDAIERLMRTLLHVEPGPFEFLDTVYLAAAGDERFIANGFTCIDWQGEPRFPAAIFDDALWALPSEAGDLDLLPEMRDWIAGLFGGDTATPEAATYDAETLLGMLAEARGELLAAFDAISHALRGVPLDEGGWNALDVLAHAIDVEAYYHAELVRCLDEPGRAWRQFNERQWNDTYRLRAAEDETILRERMDAVRSATRAWLTYQPPESLGVYVNHPERGVVQSGDRVAKIALHDRVHADQLRDMAQAAALQAAVDRADEEEDQS
jgi:ADP-ribose pyrophosphatase YjhB (NUDIX family)